MESTRNVFIPTLGSEHVYVFKMQEKTRPWYSATYEDMMATPYGTWDRRWDGTKDDPTGYWIIDQILVDSDRVIFVEGNLKYHAKMRLIIYDI